MAGPGVKITGGSSGSSAVDNDLFALFRKAISQPSRQNDMLFLQQFAARNPGSALFGGGLGGAGGSQLQGAAAALNAAAARLGGAANALTAASRVEAAVRQAFHGVAHGGAGRAIPRMLGVSGRLGGPLLDFAARRGGGALADLLAGIGGGLVGGIGGGLGLAALGYTEGALLPGQIASLQKAMLGKSAEWIKLSRSTSRLGLAGGFNFRGLRGALSPGMTAESGFLAQFGLGPQDVADLLQSYGIPIGGSAEAMNIAKSIAEFAHTRAFSAIGMAGTTQAARQGQALGFTPQSFLRALAPTLEAAGSKREDQVRILSSIEGILGKIAAQGGAGMTLAGTLRFYSRFSGSGLPGARTGEVQANVASSLTGLFQNLAKNPLALNAASLGLPAGSLSSDKGMRALMGGPLFSRLKAAPDTGAMISDIESFARSGNRALALDLFGALVSGDVDLARRIMSRGARRISPGRRFEGITFAGLTGLPLTQSYATIYGRPSGSGASISATQIAGREMLAGGGHEFEPGVDYASMLRRAGVPADRIADLIEAGRRTGVNPVELGALWHAEFSNFSMGHKTGKYRGPFAVANGPTGFLASAIAAGKTWAHDLAMAHGDTALARIYYARGPHVGFAQRLIDELTGGVGTTAMRSFIGKAVGPTGLPLPENRFTANTAQQSLTGAQTFFENFPKHAEDIDRGMHLLGSAIDGVTGKLKEELSGAIDAAARKLRQLDSKPRPRAP